MKMEIAVSAPIAGRVVRLAVAEKDSLAAGDPLAVIEPDPG